MEQYEDGDKRGVTFTESEWDIVREWVQGKAASEIVARPERLYLPVGLDSMVIVGEGDTIWWTPEAGPNAFGVVRNGVLP